MNFLSVFVTLVQLPRLLRLHLAIVMSPSNMLPFILCISLEQDSLQTAKFPNSRAVTQIEVLNKEGLVPVKTYFTLVLNVE